MNGTPQVEDGFLRIATELHGALCRIRIPGEARQLFDAILHKTYGFNKREDAISLSQLSALTGLATSEVCRGLRKLLSMNMVGKKASRGMNVWHINKQYASWKVLAKTPLANSLLAKKPKGTGEFAYQVLAKTPDTIDTLTKDNLQKTVVGGSLRSPTPAELVREFFNDEDKREAIIRKITLSGWDEQMLRNEVKKFCAHWTERNKTGKKQKWELQETFELRKRLNTWLNNVSKFSPTTHAR